MFLKRILAEILQTKTTLGVSTSNLDTDSLNEKLLAHQALGHLTLTEVHKCDLAKRFRNVDLSDPSKGLEMVPQVLLSQVLLHWSNGDSAADLVFLAGHLVLKLRNIGQSSVSHVRK